MKDEIKVGDYIRTYKGDIAKVIGYIKSIHYNTSYNEDCTFINYEVDRLCDGSLEIAECDIKNYSSNILNLIEAGDYVNGNLVIETNGKVINIFTENAYKSHYLCIFEPEKIKSIVTHEQFRNIEYEI